MKKTKKQNKASEKLNEEGQLGVWFLRVKGQAFLFMRGVEQADSGAIDLKTAPADSGQRRLVAVPLYPNEMLTMIANLIDPILAHALKCGRCAYRLAQLVDGIDDVMEGAEFSIGGDPNEPPPHPDKMN